MSSRREVLFRILAPLQRKTFISIEKSHIEMLKMALFDCAVNEKRLQCWRRTGHLPPFFCPHPGGFDSSRAPTPGNLPSKVKNARGSARGVGGRGAGAGGIDWCIMEERKWKGKESGLLLYNVSVKRSTSWKAWCIPFLLKISKWLA